MITTTTEDRIVTFSCSNAIHVYNEKSQVKPRLPYKLHRTIDLAESYLKLTKGIKTPKIIDNRK